MKLWLDDERDPENQDWWMEFPQLSRGGWTWVKTVPEAKDLILQGGITFISFDNDLGLPEEGRHLANWIEEKAYFKEIPKMGWEVHSKNTVASPLIEKAMANADQYWDREASSANWFNLSKKSGF